MNEIKKEDVKYAGFWFRVAAMLCDQVFIWTALYAVAFVVSIFGLILTPLEWDTLSGILRELSQIEDDELLISEASLATQIIYFGEYGIYIIVAIVYHTLTEASKLQGSVGKYILRVRVLDNDLKAVSWKKALLRNIMAWVLGIFTLTIGHWFAGFTKKKRALHDMVAGTIIIRET